MSLQVWLPLNGDLHNQGIANVNVTNNSAVIDDNGKIGKCYSFGTGSSYLTIDSNVLKNYTEFSFACWVNIISWNSAYATIFAVKNSTGVSWNNLIFSLLRNSSTSTLCFSISNGTNYTSTNCSTGTLSTGVWYHFVCTYKTGIIKLYQNGVLVKSYSTNIVPAFSSIANLWIGRANSNSYQTNIKLNDVRIYNHCLSQQQIKEISKGLILHYPLNRRGWGQDNLILNASTLSINKLNNALNSSTEYWAANVGQSYANFSGGEQVILSFDLEMIIRTLPVSMTVYNTNNKGPIQFPTSAAGPQINALNPSIGDTIKTKIIIPATMIKRSDSNVNNNFIEFYTVYKSNNFYKITNIKLEMSNKNTPWCPNSSEILYTTMKIGDNVQYDISGYGNNGIRYGTFTWTSDTPMYNVSTNASGGASTYLQGPILPNTATTVSLWIKGTKSNNAAIFNDKITGLQIGLLNSLLYVNSKASTKGFTTTHWKNNNWNHVVAINDNGTRSVYVNGQEETQSGASNYYIHQADHCWLWNRSYNNNYPFSGSLSDLRIYVTALSAEDVLSLYNNGAYIDQLNEIHGKVR